MVPREAATAVVEVKSQLEEKTYQQMLDIWTNTDWLKSVNVLGFAYDGWIFETFVEHLKQTIQDGQGLPNCIAVHRRNYIFIRSGYHLAPKADGRRPAKYQLAVNCAAAENKEGLSSACFLDTFRRELPPAGGHSQLYIDVYLPRWFNELPLPPEAKIAIADDGSISQGSVPIG